MMKVGTKFDKVPSCDVEAWNITSGSCEIAQKTRGIGSMSINIVKKVEPQPLTLIGFPNAYVNLISFDRGEHVHGHIVQSDCESNSLVDMFAKCGRMKEIGRDLNKKMTSLDAIIWNVKLGGLPCLHITWRLSNILNRWVKKLLKKMITLLFVLYGLLTI